MAVGGVQGDNVDAHIDQGFHPFDQIGRDADGGAYDEAAKGVFTGNRIVLDLHDVLVRDQAHQNAMLVNYRKLFDFVALQDVLGEFQGGAHRGDYEVGRGHDLPHGAVELGFEAQIAVGEDTRQFAVGGDDRNAADFELRHQLQRVAHQRIRRKRDRVDDHAAFGALDAAHLFRLLGNAHIFVDDSDTPLLSNRDSQFEFGNRIHSCRYDRGIDADFSGELGRNVYFPGEDFGEGRDQKHIVESERFAQEFGRLM